MTAGSIQSHRGNCHVAQQVAPSPDELIGKKRKAARVLGDVNAFLGMVCRLGVDGRDLFSTSDIVEGRSTAQVRSRCAGILSHQRGLSDPPYASRFCTRLSLTPLKSCDAPLRTCLTVLGAEESPWTVLAAPQVCRALWGLSRCCQQLDIPVSECHHHPPTHCFDQRSFTSCWPTHQEDSA